MITGIEHYCCYSLWISLFNLEAFLLVLSRWLHLERTNSTLSPVFVFLFQEEIQSGLQPSSLQCSSSNSSQDNLCISVLKLRASPASSKWEGLNWRKIMSHISELQSGLANQKWYDSWWAVVDQIQHPHTPDNSFNA